MTFEELQNRGTVISYLLFLLSFLLLCSHPRPATAATPDAASDTAPAQTQVESDEEALAQLQKAFNLFPYNETIRKNLAAAYVSAGRQKMKRKQFDEAASNFDHARELFPDRQDYAIQLGIALYSGKRYDEAAIELEQARQTGGDNVILLFYQGRVRYDTGDLAGALDAWGQALTLDPENKAIQKMAEKARRESTVESRMAKGYSSMFTISYDEGTKSDLAEAVLDALETAYNRVGSDLSYYPTVRVPVILYTKKDYRTVTAGPEWSGGIYDGKVRLPIGGASELTPILRGVLSHEYTHVVVGELTKGNCPSWLNEGLAQVEEKKEFDHPLVDLGKVVRNGGLLPVARLEKSLLSLSAKDAALAYQQSYALVRFMISAYGWHKIRETLVNLGAGMTIDAAIAKAFADYGLDYQQIVREWEAYLQKEYD
jgi:tetratricopeptide (TPR) repeat protein